MRTTNFLLLLFLLPACAGSHSDPVDQNKDSLPAAKQDNAAFSPKANSLSPKSEAVIYAEALLSGKIKPTENNQVFAWLDSLQSADASTRQLAFKVAEIIMLKGEGFLSEAVGSHLKTFLQLYPKDFAEQYEKAAVQNQSKLIENCAYEFYASGDDYATDIDNYMKETVANCKNCTATHYNTLTDIKNKIVSLVKIKNE